ncbi:MAG: septum formation initiator family protein [Parcubacteria group bacterium]|nr:septum formation initiator family protein [Parcubacteria group bacterium]
MRSIQKKQRFLRLLYSRLSLGLLLLVLLMGVSAVWNVYGKFKDAARERLQSKEALSGIEERITQVREDVAQLKTVEGVEEEFRTTFGLVKKGEGVIVVINDKNQAGVEEDAQGGFWANISRGLKSLLGM